MSIHTSLFRRPVELRGRRSGIPAPRWRARARRFRKEDHGAAMVEFAVVLVVLIPLLFAIIEFGYGYYVRLSLASAAREGGRWAVVRGAQSGRAANTAAVQAYVQSRTTLPVTAVVTPDGGSGNPGEVVQVVVNHATGRSSDSGCRRGRSATRHAWWSRTDRAPRITRDDDAGVATAQQMVWH